MDFIRLTINSQIYFHILADLTSRSKTQTYFVKCNVFSQVFPLSLIDVSNRRTIDFFLNFNIKSNARNSKGEKAILQLLFRPFKSYFLSFIEEISLIRNRMC